MKIIKSLKAGLFKFHLSATLSALALYSAIVAGVVVAPPRWGNNSGIAALIDKHQRLDTISSPKIVLIGGSNVSVGTDSKMIEDAVGRKVVNMGLGVSLGLRYMLTEVADQIKAGDILVVIPEYDFFWQTKKSQSNAVVNGSSDLIHLVQIFPRAVQWVMPSYCRTPNHLYGVLEDLQAFLKFKMKFYKNAFEESGPSHAQFFDSLLKPKNTIYTHRTNYNAYGDFIGHLGGVAPSKFDDNCLLNYDDSGLNAEAFQVLTEFISLAHLKGAQVVIVPPPVPEESYALRKDTINRIFAGWKNMQGAILLGTPQAYTFPKKEFFDSPYHLGARARCERTALLIHDLKGLILSLRLMDQR